MAAIGRPANRKRAAGLALARTCGLDALLQNLQYAPQARTSAGNAHCGPPATADHKEKARTTQAGCAPARRRHRRTSARQEDAAPPIAPAAGSAESQAPPPSAPASRARCLLRPMECAVSASQALHTQRCFTLFRHVFHGHPCMRHRAPMRRSEARILHAGSTRKPVMAGGYVLPGISSTAMGSFPEPGCDDRVHGHPGSHIAPASGPFLGR